MRKDFLMASFFDRMFGRNRQGSGAIAKDRLRFVLQYDRIDISPEKMEEMKREILAVISKYVAIDSEKVDIALEQRDRDHSKIVAEIPFAKDRIVQVDTTTAELDEEEQEDSENTTD
jgi:cell division topological specificity factor